MSEVEALKQPGDWEVRIETHEDAKRFSRLGAYAGFTYASIITFLALLAFFLFKSKIGEQPDKAIIMITAIILIRFSIYWLLSWRTHTGKGVIAASIMFLLFCLEMIMLTIMIFQSGMFAAVLIPILFGIIGYVMYAGVRGNWASWQFRRAARNA